MCQLYCMVLSSSMPLDQNSHKLKYEHKKWRYITNVQFPCMHYLFICILNPVSEETVGSVRHQEKEKFQPTMAPKKQWKKPEPDIPIPNFLTQWQKVANALLASHPDIFKGETKRGKGGRGCLMSPPCLKSQGCHLLPLYYLLSCFFCLVQLLFLSDLFFCLLANSPELFP